MSRRRQQKRARASVASGTLATAAVSTSKSVPTATVEQAPPAHSPWILSAGRDLLLFIATPIAIVPLFFLARQRWSIQEIALFVAAFGALGHHFPGWLRAYGDRELFLRYRLRFIVAPLFLGAVCALFAVREWSGVILIAALWGVWHGMAQTYGFIRIYDVKQSQPGFLTAKLDLAMCVAWFGVGLFLSPARFYDIVVRLYAKIGMTPLPDTFFAVLRGVWSWGTALVTVAFVFNLVRCWSQGIRPSSIKLLLMATSFGFWFYTSFAVQNLLVGVALFEIFHDVQYLSIVWIFNRNRVDKRPGIGGFMPFLFRRSGALIGLYVGLVFAYGSLDLLARGMPPATLTQILKGVLVASALLHFYYDGFIWKVRDPSTRESLGLAGGNGDRRFAPPGWLVHGARWAVFVLPLTWLGVTEARTAQQPRSELEVARALVAAVPGSPDAYTELGRLLVERGDREGARDAYERALELRPQHPVAHNNLALLAAEEGDIEGEIRHLEQALEAEPDFSDAHNNLGGALAARGDFEAAIRHYRKALEIESDSAPAHQNLGTILASRGELEEAIRHLRRASELDPESVEVQRDLARALTLAGR